MKIRASKLITVFWQWIFSLPLLNDLRVTGRSNVQRRIQRRSHTEYKHTLILAKNYRWWIAIFVLVRVKQVKWSFLQDTWQTHSLKYISALGDRLISFVVFRFLHDSKSSGSVHSSQGSWIRSFAFRFEWTRTACFLIERLNRLSCYVHAQLYRIFELTTFSFKPLEIRSLSSSMPLLWHCLYLISS